MNAEKINSISHSAILKELSKLKASDIMVPRSEVVMMDSALSFSDIVDIVIKDGHSRFPVYSEKIDNITGVLYVKDLLQYFKTIEVEFSISKILRKPLFVSENKKADELLSEFREAQVHIAIVVDEYGTFLGIISLEDILEVIIGDINDEYDKIKGEKDFMTVSENEFIVNPRMPIEEFNNRLKTKISSRRFDTIGGFVIDRFGYVPAAGEELAYGDLQFIVKTVKGSKMQALTVKRK